MSGNDPIALQVRMTEDLRAKLAASAEENGRSLNAEILWRLNQSVNTERAKLKALVDEILQERGYGIKRRKI
jgi:restriction endonuclease Mrr